MAVNSFTYEFDSILSTTLMNYRSKLYDNIFNANPFFYWLHANGRKRVEDGGERIVIPLQYGKNSTISSMSSGYSVIDTTPQDNQTAAYYNWREIAGSISISNKELVQNSGKHKIISLLEAKTAETEMSMTEELEKMMLAFTAGNGGADLLPLFQFIQKTPSTGTVGGINAASYSWWQNQAKSSSGGTWAALIAEIGNMYNTCSKGGSKGKRSHPDMILCDQESYEVYEAACRDKTRLVNETVADLGYGGLKFRGSTLLWDEYVPDVNAEVAVTDPDTYWDSYSGGTMVFINSEFLEFVVAKGQDFTVGPFIQPENQKAKTSIIYLMGEVCCSNRRKQGVLYAIDQTLAA